MKRYNVGTAVRVLPFDEIDRGAYSGIVDHNKGYYGIDKTYINEVSERCKNEALYICASDRCSYNFTDMTGVPEYVYKLRTENGSPISYWWTDNMFVLDSDLPAESISAPENSDGLFGFLFGKEDSSC